MTELSRRLFLTGAGAALFATRPGRRASAAPQMVIAGAGFAGATCAKYLRKYAPNVGVVLIDRSSVHIACPGSNEALVGLRRIQDLRRDVSAMACGRGIGFVQDEIVTVDPVERAVRLADGRVIGGDALVVAPGIGFRWGRCRVTPRPPRASCRTAGSPVRRPRRSRASCRGFRAIPPSS